MQPLLVSLFLIANASPPPTVNGELNPSVARANESLAAISSAPQLGHVAVDGRIALGQRIQLELGGWNLFGEEHPDTFVRGGWLGVRGRVWNGDGFTMDVAGRVLAGQEQGTDQAVAGLWGGAVSRLRVFKWFSVIPDFEASWMGPLFQARLANEFRFLTGNWRLGGHGGAQLWIRDGLVTVAPMIELSLGWRRHFSALDIDASGGVALARDPSAILGHPVFHQVQGELGPWAFLRLAFIPN